MALPSPQHPLCLLALTAHPDDEIVICGPSFAALKEAYGSRVRTVLAVATRGENYAREGFDPGVRVSEMQRAAETLHIDRLEFLGFRNGEMIQMLGPIRGRIVHNEREIPINTNWFTGLKPGHCWEDHVEAVRILGGLAFGNPPGMSGYDWQNARLAPLVERVVRLIRAERPEVVVTMEPFGGYGHNEHIMIHHAATAAFYLSGRAEVWPEHAQKGLAPHQPRKLYWSGLYDERPRRDDEGSKKIAQARAEMGVPKPQPSLSTRYPEVAERVYTALLAHQSQFANLQPWSELSEAHRAFFAGEDMRRVHPPLNAEDPPESSIVDGLLD